MGLFYVTCPPYIVVSLLHIGGLKPSGLDLIGLILLLFLSHVLLLFNYFVQAGGLPHVLLGID